MGQAIVRTGTLTGGRTVTLDESVPAISGKVRVVIEPVLAEPKPAMSLEAFEKTLRDRQAARGHVPPTREEVDAYLEAERESWDS